MRSDQIYRALEHDMNRFEICRLVSKGVRAAHKAGSRFEDSINDILHHLETSKPTHDSMYPAPPAADE